MLALDCGRAPSSAVGHDTPDSTDAAPGPHYPAGDHPDAASLRTRALSVFEGDPEQPGPFDVFEQRVAIAGQTGDLDATSLRTLDRRRHNDRPDDGRLPPVTVMPGVTVAHVNYAPVSRHVAGWGFVAVGNDFSNDAEHEQSAYETIEVIDWRLPTRSLRRRWTTTASLPRVTRPAEQSLSLRAS